MESVANDKQLARLSPSKTTSTSVKMSKMVYSGSLPKSTRIPRLDFENIYFTKYLVNCDKK